MGIAQSMKAGKWTRDCEGLLHPDTENASWVTQGTARCFQAMVLILHVMVAMNHKRFPLQMKSQSCVFSYIKYYHKVNDHIKWFPSFCSEK